MKINSKKVFIAVVAIILIALWIISDLDKVEVYSVEDGNTLVLNNGCTVRLIGVSSTEQGKMELETLIGESVTIQPDKSANFDPHRLSEGDVVDAYLLLNDNNYECINATLLKKGFVELVEGGHLVDSIRTFQRYASMGKNNQKDEPKKIEQKIDYSKDNIDLPQYTPQSKRRHNTWYSIPQMNINMLKEACDYNLPYTKIFANQLARRASGDFSIEQVCEIFDYCYKKWKYVNDPNGQEYIATASETIFSSLSGDCDDFAVLITSCVLAIGGNACIVYADGSNGCHAYPQVDINSFKKDKSLEHIKEVISSNFSRYSPSTLNTREKDGHVWLNLDWQAAYPGGPYFNGDKEEVYYTIIGGEWSCSQ